MCAWYAQGRISGIGSSTLKAMRDLSAGVHWALAGSRGEYAAGSGAAMRIAPLAFLLDLTQAANRKALRDVCRITHHNDEAYVGALAVALAIQAIVKGTSFPHESFLSMAVNSLPDSAVRDRIVELIQLRISPSEVASRFGATGHVVAVVPLALSFADLITDGPISTVLSQAIRVGGDADTLASITGQIAGTAVGASGIPQDLFEGVSEREEIFRIADSFAKFVSCRDDS
jgi:ADP-ribosylglycohydrolase